jgi:pimeloyl-ACP methyl ester carboxylesterase
MRMTDRKFIDVDGINTCYYEKGEGPTLVLFHGGNTGSNDGADCALDWALNFDALAEKYHVIAIDKIGQGYTDIPKKDEDYAMSAVVRHACATLDKMGIKGAHLVGHSRGGYLTCRMTMERPDLVATCTIADSNTCAPGVGLNEIVLANPPEPRLSAESQRWIMEHYSYSPAHVTDEWIDALVDVASQPQYRKAVEKMSKEGLRTTLFMPQLARDKMQMFAYIRDHGLDRPIQIIWGYNDPTATMEQCRALYDLIAARERQTQMTVFNQSGHFTYREHPEAFNACLHAFIDGTRGNR